MVTFFAEVQLASPTRPDRRRLLTIEGRAVERGAAEILITLEGRTLHTLCLFGEPGDLGVVGAYTLEGFGLGIDPVQRRLIPAIL